MKKTKHSHKLHSFTGFTLVELIVVITILAILGTIAFLSLQGYSRSARDSVRIENLTSIKKGLDMFQVVSSTYPLPEGYITLTASGTPIGYQGFLKEQGESIAKISPGGSRDPLDSNIYTTYSVNTSKTRMQLMSFLEDGGSVSAFVPTLQRGAGGIFVQREEGRNVGMEIGRGVGRGIGEIIPTSFASSTSDYTLRTPLTKGDSLGILLSSSTGTLNQPVQENYSVSSFTGVDVVNTNSGYMVYFSTKDSVFGSGDSLIMLTKTFPIPLSRDPSLLGYWDMETTTSNGKLADLSGNNNGGNMLGTTTVIGKIGNAKDFGGTANGTEINFDTTKLNFNGDFTIATWIKSNGNVSISPYQNIINRVSQDFSIYIDTTTKLVTTKVVPSDYPVRHIPVNITGTSNVLDGKWHSIHQVWNAGILKLFIDGKLEATGSSPVSTLYVSNGGPNHNIYMGGYNHITCGTSCSEFAGAIDEVRIYNRALSDSEIEVLYNATK